MPLEGTINTHLSKTWRSGQFSVVLVHMRWHLHLLHILQKYKITTKHSSVLLKQYFYFFGQFAPNIYMKILMLSNGFVSQTNYGVLQDGTVHASQWRHYTGAIFISLWNNFEVMNINYFLSTHTYWSSPP